MHNVTVHLLLCLGLVTSSAVAADLAPAIQPLHFTHRTLENGLAVYAVEEHATPTVAIQVWYHVGSKDDPAKRSGFAHLFEHMMFKGTKNTAPETLDRLTEDIGGMNNAFTNDDVTVYHEVVPSHHLERQLWAEADRMSSLIVDQKNFRSEREVVKQEYLQSVDAEPYGRFSEEILKRSFVAHPYRRTTIGSIPDLNAATLADVRGFFTSYYRPDNATLVVVGDFERKELDRWIDLYFAPVQKPAAPLNRVSVQEPSRKKEQHAMMRDAVPLPSFAATFLAPNARTPRPSRSSLPSRCSREANRRACTGPSFTRRGSRRASKAAPICAKISGW